MGYTTDFFGSFKLDRPLTPEYKIYLIAFSGTRRMRRRDFISDPIREAANLPFGVEGEFFVGGFGQVKDKDESIIDYNQPPKTQPGLWCNWEPNEDGTEIRWDGSEKFYDYIKWLDYIIKNFLIPWGYKLNGDVDWQGEREDDKGTIKVINNRIQNIEPDEIDHKNKMKFLNGKQ